MTFLNPENYFNFESMYQASNWTGIEARFNLNENKAKCMMNWVNTQSKNTDEQSFSNLMTETIYTSLNPLKENLAFNLASRSVAYYNAFGNWSCEYFMNQTTLTEEQVTTICAKYNFSDIDDVSFFVKGAWYGDYYKSAIMTATGMDET